jgi:hypothetical protein
MDTPSLAAAEQEAGQGHSRDVEPPRHVRA